MLLAINHIETLPLNNHLFNKRDITNNIKGIQNNSKRLSVIEYFKNKFGNNGILFLQETSSTFNDKIIYKNYFSGPVFNSHGTSQSRGVLNAYFGNLNFSVNKQVGDKMDVFFFLA